MDENQIQNNNASQNIKTIHTYTSDMADAIRENEASVIKIALAEKEKREREAIYKAASGTKISKLFLALGGMVLVGGAIVGSYFLFQKNQIASIPEKTVKSIETIISYDDKVFIDVTNNKNQNDLAESVKGEVEKVGKLGSIKAIFLTQKLSKTQELLPLRDLIFLMNTTAPSPLIRTLSEEYMLGTYTHGDPLKAHLFLIFKVKDYNLAYASMLEWEKTMLSDLFLLFNIDVSGARNSLFNKSWKDIVINNKDARILYATDGSDVLYYAFPNKTNFIVTDDQSTIKEINSRLLAKSTKSL